MFNWKISFFINVYRGRCLIKIMGKNELENRFVLSIYLLLDLLLYSSHCTLNLVTFRAWSEWVREKFYMHDIALSRWNEINSWVD